MDKTLSPAKRLNKRRQERHGRAWFHFTHEERGLLLSAPRGGNETPLNLGERLTSTRRASRQEPRTGTLVFDWSPLRRAHSAVTGERGVYVHAGRHPPLRRLPG